MVIAAAVLVQVLLAVGQVLLKLVAMNVRLVGWAAFTDWTAFAKVAIPSISAIAVYGLVTVLWLFVLQHLPLSRAFLFVALAFVFVPVGSVIFLGEELTIATIVGTCLIVSGIVVGALL